MTAALTEVRSSTTPGAVRSRDGSAGGPPRVLILCYAFPPANHVASMRPVRIGNAFRKRGWEVHVLRSAFHPSPDDLEVDVSGFVLHRYRPGRLSRLLARTWPRRSAKSLLLSALKRLAMPDRSWLMWRPIQASVSELGGLGRFDCVVSSSMPFVLHDVCRRRKEAGESFFWIADNRDMWAGNRNRRSFAPFWYEEQVERRTFRLCDAATFTSPTTAAVYEDRHKIEATVVLNGFDGEASPPAGRDTAAGESIRFVHTGVLHLGRRDLSPLLQAISLLADEERRESELVLAGFDSAEIARKLATGSPVAIRGLGQVSRSDALRLQRDADFLIIATANNDYHASYTPAKLLEYAFAGKPVIALAREESDVGKLVRRHRLGVASFDPRRIFRFIEDTRANGWPGPLDLHELTADAQFGKFVRLAEKARARHSAAEASTAT